MTKYRVVGALPIDVCAGHFLPGAEGVVLTEHEARELQRTGAVTSIEVGPVAPAIDDSGLAEPSTPAPKSRKQ